jgi:hypothetical protein
VTLESFANAAAVFRGKRFALDVFGSQALWFAFGDDAGDLEITPEHFRVRMPKHQPIEYKVATAAGVLSFLLADVIDARSVRMRIKRTKVQTDRMPEWTCPSRYVLAESWISRVVVRLRVTDAELDEAIPPITDNTFVKLSHACPHCHEVPDRYELARGSLVCGSCGRSSDPPSRSR